MSILPWRLFLHWYLHFHTQCWHHLSPWSSYRYVCPCYSSNNIWFINKMYGVSESIRQLKQLMKSTFCQLLMNVNEFHFCQLRVYYEIPRLYQYLCSKIEKGFSPSRLLPCMRWRHSHQLQTSCWAMLRFHW